jgi:hypothetical protein
MCSASRRRGDKVVTLRTPQRLGEHLVGDPFDAVVEFLATTTVLRELLQDCQGPAASDKLNQVV